VNKASEGFLYPLGGFCVWGGDPVNTEDFKRKLTAILSADVASVRMWQVTVALWVKMRLPQSKR
jgi:hypothetical protein